MKVDAKEIIERLKQEDDRIRINLFVSEKVWERFKKDCAKALPSHVVEDLMKQFSESLKKD